MRARQSSFHFCSWALGSSHAFRWAAYAASALRVLQSRVASLWQDLHQLLRASRQRGLRGNSEVGELSSVPARAGVGEFLRAKRPAGCQPNTLLSYD
jgi:heme exporter protein D